MHLQLHYQNLYFVDLNHIQYHYGLSVGWLVRDLVGRSIVLGLGFGVGLFVGRGVSAGIGVGVGVGLEVGLGVGNPFDCGVSLYFCFNILNTR